MSHHKLKLLNHQHPWFASFLSLKEASNIFKLKQIPTEIRYFMVMGNFLSTHLFKKIVLIIITSVFKKFSSSTVPKHYINFTKFIFRSCRIPVSKMHTHQRNNVIGIRSHLRWNGDYFGLANQFGFRWKITYTFSRMYWLLMICQLNSY